MKQNIDRETPMTESNPSQTEKSSREQTGAEEFDAQDVSIDENLAHRRRHQRKRWAGVISMGLWAGAVLTLCRPFITSKLAKPEQLTQLDPCVELGVAAVILIGFFAYIAHGRWQGFFGTKHFWRYPPLWVSVAIGFLVVEGCHALSTALSEELGPGESHAGHLTLKVGGIFLKNCGELLLGAVVTLSALALITLARAKPSPLAATKAISPGHGVSESRSLLASKTPLESIDQLLRWIRDDKPIETPAQDYFGHSNVAERIADRLSTTNAKAPTIALVGDKGTGKSTILALVEYYLREKGLLDKKIALIKVTLWPFETADAAANGILNALTEELGKHVNTLAITTIGKQYVQAISATGLDLGILTSFFEGAESPEGLIKRIESIAAAIDLRLVLWIEDLERFAGASRLPTEGKPDDKLGSIRAMLYLLDQSDHISVLLSDASLEFRFDPQKIARFVEHPPKLELVDVWDVVSKFRTNCLESPRYIDPAASSIRRQLQPADSDSELEAFLRREHPARPQIRESVAIVLSHPRTLKSVLRLTDDIWRQLVGEIDFDDVFLVTAIRVAYPQIFSIIEEEIEVFRRGLPSKQEHPAHDKLHKAFEAETDTIRANAIKCVFRFLFPRYNFPYETEQQRENDNATRLLEKPQGVATTSHADYWHLYASVPEISDRDSDQAVIKALRQCNESETRNRIELFFIRFSEAKINTFCGQLTVDGFCHLIKDVGELLTVSDIKNWQSVYEHAWRMPHFNRIHAVMNLKSSPYRALSETIDNLILSHIERNVSVAYMLLRLNIEAQTSDSAGIFLCIKTFAGALVRRFKSEPENRFAEALRDVHPFTLAWIDATIQSRPLEHNAVPFLEELGPTMLKAAEKYPDVMLPQLVLFFVGSRRFSATGEPLEFNYDQSRTQEIFGDVQRIIDLYHENEPPKASWDNTDLALKNAYRTLRYATAKSEDN